MAANPLPLGMTPLNTGDLLVGSVTVTPVLFESDGTFDTETQDWTPQEIQDTLAKVDEGVNWWSRALDRLGTAHTLDFVIDDSFAVDPVETGYEPIDHSSQTFEEYVGTFLIDQGYGDAPSIERAVQWFNHDQRIKHQTDWAFTIFVIDASDDPDGLFTSGGQFAGAFAYAGGLFIITPSTRPAPTIAHEMGHIFWARDEYAGGASYTDRRGYYDAAVLNAANNPDPDFVHQESIMRGGVPLTAAYLAETSPESTLALVGWRDSDSDGVFDFADVPLDLDAIGYFDHQASEFLVTGTASAVPLRNQNSSGVQSDITLNRVSELQYRLDGGPWITASSPDQQVVSFDLAIPILGDFLTIDFRAIDVNLGVTSEILSGDWTTPAVSSAAITGYAFVDTNENGIRDPDETLMSDAQVVVQHGDGTPLFAGGVAAGDFQVGEIEIPTPGVQLSAEGLLMASNVGSFDSTDAGKRVFQGFNTHTDQWLDGWSDRNAFVAEFEQVVGEVDLSVTGLSSGSYARIEAYDSSGDLITRVTTDLITDGETRSVAISDPRGRIASIKAFGHAETFVAIDGMQFGYSDLVITDPSGAWKIENLADGDYRIDLVPDKLIHWFSSSSILVSVSGGRSEQLAAAAKRVDSPRHNPVNAYDVGADGEVTSRDALLVINDMNRHGPRILGPDETGGDYVDVNNDGLVSALDALLVINSLATQQLEAEQTSTRHQAPANDTVLESWTDAPAVASLELLASRQPKFESVDRAIEDESAGDMATDIETVSHVGDWSGSGLPAAESERVENVAKTTKASDKQGENAILPALTNTEIEAENLEPLVQAEV